MKDIIVIGAGAAGLMAAYSAAAAGGSVTVLERNEKAGKKIYITGKGRCNFTNFSDVSEHMANIISNPKFMYSAYSAMNAFDVYAFFEEHGLRCKVERGNRAFPVSDHASDITGTLVRACMELGVTFEFNKKVTDVDRSLNVKLENGEIRHADRVVIATGGMSYPSTGSDGTGFSIMKRLGHSITALYPGLVSLKTKEDFVKDIEGLSLRNTGFRLSIGDKVIYSERGELVFTRNGMSGPLVLTASEYLNRERRKIKSEDSDPSGDIFKLNPVVSLDLKPALTKEQLDKRILRDFRGEQNKNLRNSLKALLPSSFISPAVRIAGLDPYKKINSITHAERERLVDVIKDIRLHIISSGSFDEAVITDGGVDTAEIDPRTMESKIVSGLYLAGEMIDVDALTGGYNLQIAWSTGYLAGKSAAA